MQLTTSPYVRPVALLEFTSKGIYCAEADVYIDPWRKVDKALITHAHSDHARPGSRKYLCTHLTKPILLHRLGHNHFIDSVEYGEEIMINGVKFSFHPAGHIVGSAQIRVEFRGEIWVVSGDYKTESDSISGDFEPVRCHAFITESTFGLPVYQWTPQNEVIDEINTWWRWNAEHDICSIISAYSLGKAQRVIHQVDNSIGPIYTHGAVQNMNDIIRALKVSLPKTEKVTTDTSWASLKKALVVAPGSALSSPWMKHFKRSSVAFASGWMALRGTRRWRSVDRGFVLSDHADWNGLNWAIKETGAEKIIVTHGYQDVFTRWLREQGYDAYAEKTMYESEDVE